MDRIDTDTNNTGNIHTTLSSVHINIIAIQKQ